MKRAFLACALLSLALYLPAVDERPREFVVSFFSDDINLNPLNAITSTEAQLYTALYEGLVGYNPLTLDPVPAVARDWEISDGGRTYTFTLREDARYWNGDPVRAEDFRRTWLTFLSPKVKAEYSFLYDVIEGAFDFRTGKSTDEDSVGIEVVNPTTLRVRLEKPASHFLKILCHHSFVPIHPRMLERRDWSDLPSVLSNGPYYIRRRTATEIELVRNELYWDFRRVAIPVIRVLFRDDPEETTAMFNKGEIDWVTGGIDFEVVEDRSAITLNPMFATSYFYFAVREQPWNNAKVRRALALLAPWKEIRSPSIHFIPATTLVPPIPYYPAPKTIAEQDVGAALELLSEAGFPGGRGLPSPVIKVPENWESRRVAALLASAWKEKLGLDTRILSIPFEAYYAELKKPDYTLATLTWIGDFADPLTFLKMWTSESNLNDAGFADEAYDALVAAGIGDPGPARYKALSEAESMILEGGLVLPVSHAPAINLIDLTAVSGWFPNPLDIHPFKYFRFTAGRVPRGVAGLSAETRRGGL